MRNPETGEQPGLWEALFGCHKGDPGTGTDLACAGWLVRFGIDHPRVRYLLLSKRLPSSALEPGPNWPPLHETWADVVRAHTLPDVDGNLATGIDETDVPGLSASTKDCDEGALRARERLDAAADGQPGDR